MRPLLYIPKTAKDQQPREHMADVGLEEIAAGLDVRQVAEGPDNTGGLLFGWLSPTQSQFDHFPNKQTWVPSAKRGDLPSGAYWIGMWDDSPPTEEDLRRPDHRPGAQVVLGNGESWAVPTPNSPERFPQLNADGTLTWVVDERYNWLVTDLDKRKSTGALTTEVNGKEHVSFIFDDEADFWFLARVLQINYRVTPEVVAHMRLLTQDTIRAMVAGMLGMTLVEA